MTNLFTNIQDSLRGNEKTIILPEGTDARVLEAASRLQAEGLVKPILLGDESGVTQAANAAAIDITGVTIIDPKKASYFEELAEKFVERRNGKATLEQAREQL